MCKRVRSKVFVLKTTPASDNGICAISKDMLCVVVRGFSCIGMAIAGWPDHCLCTTTKPFTKPHKQIPHA